MKLYNIFSIEDIEKWAKVNDLHDKVSSDLWLKYQEAKYLCEMRNYSMDIDKNTLKKNYNKYNDYIQICIKIIHILSR